MAINRRDFLRLGTAGVALGAMSPLANPWFKRSLQAAMMGAENKKMLILFLRGGADGANILIPGGDTTGYSDASDRRPTLYISEEDGYDLGHTFAYAHPNLANMLDTIPSADLALCHRIGYVGMSRSHFSGQQYWENATDFISEEGWVNRLVQTESSIDDLGLPAASVSNGFQVLFRGSRPLAHIPNLSTYSIGDGPLDLKLLGELPSVDVPDGTGILGTYSRTAEDLPYDEIVRGNGISLAESLNELNEQGVDPDDYEDSTNFPTNSSPGDWQFDGGALGFFRQARNAVQLLRETECRVAGVELGGWDTHSNQEQGNRMPRLLSIVSDFFAAAYQDLDDEGMWDDTVVCMISEFGRTSAENGSVGTDHAEASTMFLAGGNVNGGVYNCDDSTWDDDDMFSTPVGNPRYIAQVTDFRAILAEIMSDHYGLGTAQVDDVVPGYSSLSGSVFDELDIME